ncbi:solute carrier family 35 related protein [Nitzschia inconspicua]|uniref:Solute carrier family 35 related protein n=1 Tax=Nitzschia inconspicua TaxID=303405 RepID=A0A9K3L4W0_9STRA|nr:solute carrier family 35 related protein [Nitzschia inconspicua]
MSGGGSDSGKKCGLFELIVFVVAIVFGTACSILSKTMMSLHGEGKTGETEQFEKPIFQTFGMFLGMCFGLVMHYVVCCFRIPFPGYTHGADVINGATTTTSETTALLALKKGEDSAGQPTTPTWMYFFLAIPAIFDLGATALCMMGLRYIDVSIYQLLRGSGIIFVAIMKQHILKDHLYRFQWVGVFFNVLSVFMVGSTAILSESKKDHPDEDDNGSAGRAFLGILLVMLGALVQAMQFVFEEKVLTMDIPSPPLLLIGMEGLWGTILCLVVVYPLVYLLPGDDHGSYEDPFNTWFMFKNEPHIQIAFAVYFVAIFGYNFFAVLVTFLLNSVWHAILDNFRPITVWITDLFIFYVISTSFGEQWTVYSWIQVAGMFVLLYGTAIYNAPNAGSISLEGDWFALGLDFSPEYDSIRREELEREQDEQFKQRMLHHKMGSSFFGEIPPSLV